MIYLYITKLTIMSIIGTLTLLAAAFVIYFLPSILGWNKRNAAAIIALNLFLGWTFIGWVAAFIWSLTVDKAKN